MSKKNVNKENEFLTGVYRGMDNSRENIERSINVMENRGKISWFHAGMYIGYMVRNMNKIETLKYLRTQDRFEVTK